MLFVIGCKEVTDYKEKHKIIFKQYDSVSQIMKKNKIVLVLDTLYDQEKNAYKTIQIGTQIWMAENLRTTKYVDNTIIHEIINDNDWSSRYGVQCLYNNYSNPDTISKYGRLYNWYAVETEKLCPKGWHVPTNSEWDTLENFLMLNFYGFEGKDNEIGKAMASTEDWMYADVPGFIGFEPKKNNKSSFNATPAGCRVSTGTFYFKGKSSNWWSSTEYDKQEANYRFLQSFNGIFSKSRNPKDFGMSIRCIKN